MRWLDNIRNKKIIKNRKVTKARFLYMYIIFGSIAGFLYLMASLVFGLPKHFSLTPLYLLVLFVLYRFLVENWKGIWLYVKDVEQGKLMLFLNDNTHWSEEHKLKVVKWVYLDRKTVRQETHAKISVKIMDKEKLSDEEKLIYTYSSVACPQQIKLGFNEPLLVNALIHAHKSIQVLDYELRDIMNLTKDHILAFDLVAEYRKAGGDEYDKFIEIGERASAKLNTKKG